MSTTASTLPVTAVFAAYDSGDGLLAAVASAWRAGVGEAIVVDNASTDGAAERVRRAWPRTQIISLATNVGFAAACNLGARSARSPYVLLQNDDARIAADYLERLLPALVGRPRRAAAMGKILCHDEPVPRIDSAGIALCWRTCTARDRGHGRLDAGQYDLDETVFGVTGAAALYDREVFLQAGGFDETLFAYHEDVELSWRLNRAGYEHRYVAHARAFHARRNLAGKSEATTVRAHLNRYRVWSRHARVASLCAVAPVALPRELLRMGHMFARCPRVSVQVARGLSGAVWDGIDKRRQI